ncbi:MAG: transcription elongation factor GreA [Candidatus Harrisonbacteria bacterium CG10_big_fil_rev_8_21_14_0_10_42_17]|uniref:Transcription elongation factor GreA n=1 Tax=Candidatus Harrisonbacteria bacterium CG10_big_fil_rev_8_21_14_0_10_42_17 TaxID=1974584 RepID=A0A2M6WHM1_9BACT|nr:MAG: transcription elongation factor GreA [Candidatus Harrisonbacteria bacterium CG10_big_fil_rev_8_21_14_0_10_42_17]
MDHYFTQRRLDELKQELQDLKTKRRLEVADRLQKAKELGDLSENSEYFEARDEQARVEQRILELDQMIKNAKIIEEKTSGDIIQIGSTIQVKKGSEIFKYRIVGSEEVKPEEGFISNESPLGKAFIGRKVGDKVTITVPAGSVVYEVVRIG